MPRIFISSTCYDLVDLRADLREHLEAQGFIVTLSEDIQSGFYVDPTVDSIASCLLNVDLADLVICVVDRRYGPSLGSQYQDRSATHVEVERARELQKPVLFFIRNVAWQEFQQMKRSDAYQPVWVERARKQQWQSFVASITAIPESDQWSNWIDQFQSVCDLKRKIDRRIEAVFPAISVGPALHADRLARLYFSTPGSGPWEGYIPGIFRNGTRQLALNVVHGCRWADEDRQVGARATLAFQERLSTHSSDRLEEYPFRNPPVGEYLAVFCEYENGLGDRYRIEIPVIAKDYSVDLPTVIGPHATSAKPIRGISRRVAIEGERFFVLAGQPMRATWIEIPTRSAHPTKPPVAIGDGLASGNL